MKGYERRSPGAPVEEPVPPTTMMITRECPICHIFHTVQVPTEGWFRWKREGWLIQDAFPGIPKEERELLITGVDDVCWQQLWAYLEDEDDDDDAA